MNESLLNLLLNLIIKQMKTRQRAKPSSLKSPYWRGEKFEYYWVKITHNAMFAFDISSVRAKYGRELNFKFHFYETAQINL